VQRLGRLFEISAYAWLTFACSKPHASVNASDPVASEVSDSNEQEADDVAGVEGESDALPEDPLPGSSGNSAALLTAAMRVLETMSGTSYSHRTRVSNGEYDLDCSGFLDYLLARVNPPALAELRSLSVKRPLAKHYVAVLALAEPKQHWSRVPSVAALAPGDLIAWDKPDDVTSSNTGHVMLVFAAARLEGDRKWTVPIIDSSASPHGAQDARHTRHTTGIGRGTIVLETDANGSPVAYRWSPGKASRRHETHIELGRIR